MWPHTESVPLPAAVFTILRDLIHERAGAYYNDDKRGLLADKLSARVMERGFANFLDYYYLLKYGPDSEAEWPHVLDALSVQETYFWREADQIHAFTSEILPAFAAAGPRQPVQVWCAACATGEEPLTIAMALLESGWFGRMPIRIFASDASGAAIANARQGIYRQRSFRSTPKPLQDKYFVPVAGGWKVCQEVAARVEFSQANLMNACQIEAFARSPLIFCRNVFIYFSPAAISQTVKFFAEKMQRPGYLFVGASESLLKLSTDFELQSAGKAFVYALK